MKIAVLQADASDEIMHSFVFTIDFRCEDRRLNSKDTAFKQGS
jgi:hypothetical protein